MFETSVLEPLQKRVEEGSSMAENLIQTAAPGVDTEQLESELESLNDKWTDLKKKVRRGFISVTATSYLLQNKLRPADGVNY